MNGNRQDVGRVPSRGESSWQPNAASGDAAYNKPHADVGRVPSHGAAPTGRKKLAQGKSRSDAALGNPPPNTSSPEGAKEHSLGKLVRPRREKAIPAEHPELSYIGLEHIEAHTTKLLGSVPAAEMKSTANRFRTGDVLYSRLRPYLNKVWRADRDGLCSSEFIVLPGNESVDAGFFRYRLNAADFVSFANSLNAGDRPRVDFDQISSFCLPPFSLAEQRRIVAEIEKQFTRLEAGVAALRRMQANLKRYRAAVLKSACEGQLVPTEAELSRTADYADSADGKMKLSASSASSASSAVKSVCSTKKSRKTSSARRWRC